MSKSNKKNKRIQELDRIISDKDYWKGSPVKSGPESKPKVREKKPFINKAKAKFLEEGKSRDCVSNFTKKGMDSGEARKHCEGLWKKELKKRATGRTVNV